MLNFAAHQSGQCGARAPDAVRPSACLKEGPPQLSNGCHDRRAMSIDPLHACPPEGTRPVEGAAAWAQVPQRTARPTTERFRRALPSPERRGPLPRRLACPGHPPEAPVLFCVRRLAQAGGGPSSPHTGGAERGPVAGAGAVRGALSAERASAAGRRENARISTRNRASDSESSEEPGPGPSEHIRRIGHIARTAKAHDRRRPSPERPHAGATFSNTGTASQQWATSCIDLRRRARCLSIWCDIGKVAPMVPHESAAPGSYPDEYRGVDHRLRQPAGAPATADPHCRCAHRWMTLIIKKARFFKRGLPFRLASNAALTVPRPSPTPIRPTAGHTQQ